MKTNHPSSIVDSKGFTLIELLVAMFIGLFLVAGVVSLVSFSTQTYRAQERISDVQQDARAALEIMARDLRMTGFSPERFLPDAAGLPDLITADAGTIRIAADLDMNGTIDENGLEDITYTVSGGVLNRITDIGTANEQTSPLIGNVNSMTIAYLDNEGNFSAAAGDVTFAVRITLRCQGRDASGGTFERTLSTTVAARNLVLMPEGGVS